MYDASASCAPLSALPPAMPLVFFLLDPNFLESTRAAGHQMPHPPELVLSVLDCLCRYQQNLQSGPSHVPVCRCHHTPNPHGGTESLFCDSFSGSTGCLKVLLNGEDLEKMLRLSKKATKDGRLQASTFICSSVSTVFRLCNHFCPNTSTSRTATTA